MDEIKGRIDALQDELLRLRRDLHAHPELGFQELRTGQVILDYLGGCGIETEVITETGVVGLLRTGRPGPTLMIRADMDALPVEEETGLPFASKTPGVMHACGHDGHVAMLLVAARILSEQKEQLRGTIRFCFQPNEEEAGAERMIQDGVLENPKVDLVTGVHLWTPLPCGTIGLSDGAVMAGMDNFWLTIRGKGGHSGEPHKAIDPITAACAVVSNISFMEKRQIGALNPTIMTVNTIHGGTATNIISEKVEMSGSLRYLYDASDEGEQRPRVRFAELVKNICAVYGTTCELTFKLSSNTLINDAGAVSLLRPAAEEVVGAEQIRPHVSMAGEDFAEFTRRVPGAFAFIGAGNEENAKYPHHHPKFDIDERALRIGVEYHVRAAMRFLKRDGA